MNRQDVEEARKTIGDLVKRTPLRRSDYLSNYCSGEVYLKLENLQATNSFKMRGALNRMMHLSPEEMRQGIVAASAGNHAQAVAIAAERLRLSAKIVVPKTTPKVKIDKIRKHDVELILHGDIYDEAEQKAIDLAKKERLTYISPYNDSLVIAGQGTIGIEILEDLPDIDTVIVPVGGGGLISGIGLAVKSVKPEVKVVGVQSEASPAMYESLKAGRIVDVEVRESVADGLSGGIERGSITFDMTREFADDFLLVKEETIRKAVFLLWIKESQIVEGAGAVAIAPIIENRDAFVERTIVSVITGGNIEEELFQSILASEASRANIVV